MRFIIFTFLFLFTTASLAEDISDFEIEGISIGDSALKFFSENDLIKKKQNYYKDKKFTAIDGLKLNNNLMNYDFIDLNYKTNDTNFIIFNISGRINFDKNIEDCYKKMDEIISELKKVFKSAKFYEKEVFSHRADDSGNSKITDAMFELNTGFVVVQCYDWSAKFNEEFNYTDNLTVSIDSMEFYNWMSSGVY
tara:strand:+ start:106 stop:687 length:582 start_codon:yes stop_codon:yes gene_type:complete